MTEKETIEAKKFAWDQAYAILASSIIYDNETGKPNKVLSTEDVRTEAEKIYQYLMKI